MKKLTTLLLILSLVLSLVACSEEKEPLILSPVPDIVTEVVDVPATTAVTIENIDDGSATTDNVIPDETANAAPARNNTPTQNTNSDSANAAAVDNAPRSPGGHVPPWDYWFSISFEDWFGNTSPAPLRTDGGGLHYRHPQDQNSVLIFSRDSVDYPVRISIPVSKLLGTSKTSVEELKKIYGDKLVVENFGMTGWAAQVENHEGFSLLFLLNGENDTNITSVEIGKR